MAEAELVLTLAGLVALRAASAIVGINKLAAETIIMTLACLSPLYHSVRAVGVVAGVIDAVTRSWHCH